MPPSAPSPPISYTTSPTLHAFSSPRAAFIAANPPIHDLIVGAVVTNQQGRILLVRRAPHDSWPLQWEVPGGSVDDEDADFVAAVVRELWEETGLRAKHVKSVVRLAPEEEPKTVDVLETGLEMLGDVLVFSVKEVIWGKLTAWVDVESCDTVTICDDEHVEFAWVTEEETRDRKFNDGRELDFVSEGVRRTVLEGFRLWKEEQEKGSE
ncbi:hypothetical protein FDECE_11920 [Fusarium decemcellulare]|nr:hypothetical protein FDECE_11920 [Fusarium decemcellulare]